MRLPFLAATSHRFLPFLLAIAVTAIWFSARYQFAHMDSLFFQESFAGRKGLVLYLLGDYSRAARAYRAHFRSVYQDDTPLSENLQEAKKRAMTILAQDADSVPALLDLSEVVLREKDYSRAQELLDHVLKEDQGNADALLLSSLVYAHSGAYEKAIDPLNVTLRNSRIGSRISAFLLLLETTGDLAGLSSGGLPRCLLAHYYRYLRIYDESNGRLAIRNARAAIEAGDRPADAYLTIGVVHDKQGEKKEALAAFLKSVDANQTYATGYWWASIEYGKLGDLAGEYQMIKTAVEKAPADAFYTRQLQHVLLDKLGDAYQAADLLQRIISTDPGNADAHARLGYAYYFLGKYEQSLNHFRDAISINQKDPIVYERMAEPLIELGQIEEAIAVLSKAIAIAPYRIASQSRLGDLHIDKRRWREAITAYEEAFNLGMQDSERYKVLCNLYGFTGEIQRSLDCYKRVVAADPRDHMAQRVVEAREKYLKLEQSQR